MGVPTEDKYNLNPRQKKFADLFITSGNAVQTYLAVYDTTDYGVAASCANRLLNNEKISRYIGQRRRAADKRALERLGLSKEKVLKDMMIAAGYDPRGFFDEDGGLLPVNELPEELAAVIIGVKYDSSGQVEYKLEDKSKAREQLAKHLGLYEKHNMQQSIIIHPPGVDKPADAGT